MKLVSFANTYRQNSVQTASPGQLILMLFDGALRFMSRALEGYLQEHVIARNEAIHVNLLKTQAIIDELQASLDHTADAKFSRTMSDLYDYMRAELRKANVRKEAAPVQIVMSLLRDIREAWSAMLAQSENSGSSSQRMEATAA